MKESASASRMPGLDVLRAVAVLLVFGRHLPAPDPGANLAVASFLELWFTGGWVGVDLFFVLSGFLVSGLIFAEQQETGRFSLGRFWLRRALKIYPAFLIMILVTVVVQRARGLPIPGANLLAELVFLQNYLPAVWSHTWSLAIEEHFYLALPVVLALAGRPGDRFGRLPGLIAGILAVCFLLRVLASEGTYTHARILFPTHLRIDSLFVGVALAYLRAFHPDALGAVPRHRLALRLAGALCLAPAFLLPLETTRWISVSGLSLFSLGSALLVLSVLHAAPHPATAPLRFLGRHSYSIYLWHMPVFLWVPLALESALGVRLAYDAKILVCLSAGLLVGVALSTGLEIPILRLRDRWFPRASGPDFSSMSR